MPRASESEKLGWEPQVGELWRDLKGEHNLILDGSLDEGDLFYKLLTLETGHIYPLEPLSSWITSNQDPDRPFYCTRIG